jgi:hypothetical protein
MPHKNSHNEFDKLLQSASERQKRLPNIRPTVLPSKPLWDFILDHPKLALVLGVLALAITFSPRLSAVATWLCITIAGVLFFDFWLTGRQRSWGRLTKYLLPILTAILLAVFGAWLTSGWPFREPGTDAKIDAILEILKANQAQMDTSLPGWSMHMLIKLHDSKTRERETIYDDSSFSVYLSAEKYLTLSYRDTNGEISEIRSPFGKENGVPEDEVMLLSAELGFTGKATILDIAVNGKKVALETIPGWLRPNPSAAEVKPIIGCDVNASHCASFVLYGMSFYRRTLTPQDMYETAVSFKGSHSEINYPLPQRFPPPH